MAEVNTSGSTDPSGWYRHKDTGAVVELVNDPELGTPLTNAFVAAGYEYVGDEKPKIAAPKAEKEAK